MKKSLILGLTILLLTGLFTVACQSNGKENEDGSRVTQTGNGDEEVAGDFVLTISVEKTTLTAGELNYKSFQVYPELKNLSGRDMDITVDLLFRPTLPGWRPDPIDWPISQTILFPKNGVIRREPGRFPLYNQEPFGFAVGSSEDEESTLSVGTHELNFSAVFGLEGQRVSVDSNTVLLTVLP